MKGSQFVFESVHLLYYSLHKINLNRGESYIDSPSQLKNKKVTINPKNNDNECFKYAGTTAINHEKIRNHPERISNLQPFIVQYNWEGIEFPSHSRDCKKFEQNNKTIALNILYVSYNTKQMRHAYISKYNNKPENKVILLMITDGKRSDRVEKYHYLVVKTLSTLLKGITSNHDGDFYCLNCFLSYRTKETLKKHKKVCDNHDYCYVKMPSEYEKNIKIQPRRNIIKSSGFDLY